MMFENDKICVFLMIFNAIFPMDNRILKAYHT